MNFSSKDATAEYPAAPDYYVLCCPKRPPFFVHSSVYCHCTLCKELRVNVHGSVSSVRKSLQELPSRWASDFAQHLTDVYGYLLATVSPDGTIQFEFKQVNEADVTENTRKDYTDEFIHNCFVGNSSTYVPEGASCPMKYGGRTGTDRSTPNPSTALSSDWANQFRSTLADDHMR